MYPWYAFSFNFVTFVNYFLFNSLTYSSTIGCRSRQILPGHINGRVNGGNRRLFMRGSDMRVLLPHALFVSVVRILKIPRKTNNSNQSTGIRDWKDASPLWQQDLEKPRHFRMSLALPKTWRNWQKHRLDPSASTLL
jgi:hypothetical protein